MRLRAPPLLFTSRVVLPGESVAEFEALQAELLAELAPQGRLEVDAVHSLAKCLWRKARLDGLTRAERPQPTSFEAVMDPQHPRYQPGKWTRVVVRQNMDGPPLPPYVPGSWTRVRASPAETQAKPDAPTFEAVMEAFAAEARFDAQIERPVRRITRLQARRPASRGRPNDVLTTAVR